MKERPILFSGPMVRALLDGSKTQTRRVVKVRNELPPDWATFASEGHSPSLTGEARPTGSFYWSEEQPAEGPLKTLRRWPILPAKHPMAGDWYWTPSPFGKVGDRLWVRETLAATRNDHGYIVDWHYVADNTKVPRMPGLNPDFNNAMAFAHLARKAVPSIHMPRWASRITLEVTGVRVDRLQGISEADARNEGAVHAPLLPMGWKKAGCDSDDTVMRSRFAALWDGLNAARGFGWNANPWVWVVEFKRVT
jgi:hypothetical protein